MLNKQLAMLTWRLLNMEATTDEQAALAERLEEVGQLIRTRLDVR
jgi:Trp operon repressor